MLDLQLHAAHGDQRVVGVGSFRRSAYRADADDGDAVQMPLKRHMAAAADHYIGRIAAKASEHFFVAHVVADLLVGILRRAVHHQHLGAIRQRDAQALVEPAQALEDELAEGALGRGEVVGAAALCRRVCLQRLRVDPYQGGVADAADAAGVGILQCLPNLERLLATEKHVAGDVDLYAGLVLQLSEKAMQRRRVAMDVGAESKLAKVGRAHSWFSNVVVGTIMRMPGPSVIHVAFGKKRGKKPAGAPASDPLASLYTVQEVGRLFGYSPRRLRYWASSGLLEPSGGSTSPGYYTFQDLVGLRTAKGLLEAGVPLRQVRRSVETLRRILPRLSRPLAEVRIRADGQTVVVQDEHGAFEALTGQQVLDFRIEVLRADVVRTLRPAAVQPPPTSAYDHYLTACRLEMQAASADEAEQAYRQAIALDPSFANAMTNLGNLRFRLGDAREAESWYRQALRVHDEHPEALYNLGYLFFQRGEKPRAIEYFARAVQQEPAFADAHFNLALAYDELDQPEQARPHWQTYLQLEPQGSSAQLARRRLQGWP